MSEAAGLTLTLLVITSLRAYAVASSEEVPEWCQFSYILTVQGDVTKEIGQVRPQERCDGTHGIHGTQMSEVIFSV